MMEDLEAWLISEGKRSQELDVLVSRRMNIPTIQHAEES